MTRFLGLVLLAVLVWVCLEAAWARLRTALGASRPQPPSELAGEPLVRCAGCGVHVPRSRLLAGATGRTLCDRCRSLEARA